MSGRSKSICHLVLGPASETRKKSKLPLDTHIFLAQNFSLPEGFVYDAFKPERFLQTEVFSGGSGPIDFLSIVQFIREFDAYVFSKQPDFSRKIVCFGGPTRRSFTNTAFLLGAYLILKLDLKASSTAYHFRGIDPSAFEPFMDPSASHSDFTISVAECWNALERSKECGWISFPAPNTPYCWGLIDSDEYAHYNDPLNADLHELVPGRLFAMRAPKQILGGCFCDM